MSFIYFILVELFFPFIPEKMSFVFSLRFVEVDILKRITTAPLVGSGAFRRRLVGYGVTSVMTSRFYASTLHRASLKQRPGKVTYANTSSFGYLI